MRLMRRPQVRNDPSETRIILRRAVGQTFLLEEFTKYGFAEPDLHKVVPWNSANVEQHLGRVKQGGIVPSLRWRRRQLAI